MLLDEFNATREVVEVWNDLLVENIDQTLITRIPHLRNQFPEDELTGDFPRPTTGAGGLGTTTRQPFSRSTINFRGAWHPMQQFLIELETSLPQLQLESLTITPDRNPEFLNYSLQYTAWNKAVE